MLMQINTALHCFKGEHLQQITYPTPQYQKVNVLVIGGTPTDYQSNPHYLKVFGNHQNTPPSRLNVGSFFFTLFLMIAFW